MSEPVNFMDAAVRLGRAVRYEIPWNIAARISADEEIATSQARADRQRDEARHRFDPSPYIAILLAFIAAGLIIWWAGS